MGEEGGREGDGSMDEDGSVDGDGGMDRDGDMGGDRDVCCRVSGVGDAERSASLDVWLSTRTL